jgi:hypothetical protein
VAEAAVAPCAAPAGAKVGDLQILPQLPYYADPAQLRLSRDDPAQLRLSSDAPSWAKLLVLLDAATPNRDPTKPPPASPAPGNANFPVWLPLVAR